MANINNVSPVTLKKWLDNNEAILVDVREIVEYKSCSIANAKHLPLSQVNIDKTNFPDCKNKKLVLHCKSGKRSMMACQKLIDQGIEFDIWNLEGGIDGWKNSGLATTSSSNILPIERQTQIAISLLVLLGLSLNYFLNDQLYLLIPFIVSIGLLNAGVTGWCGMAKLIAKMPWNK